MNITANKRSIAAALWPRYSWAVDSVNTNAAMSKWHRQHLKANHFPNRCELHEFVFRRLQEPIDYLEFGVFEGRSLRAWTEMATSPENRFFGFDTFTGLPERWNLGVHSMARGHFAVDRPPQFNDPRVTLVKGLFQDTLPGFLEAYDRRPRIVVHCDADLYSSTLYLLTQISNQLLPGDVLIFDEFSQPLHEYRAFMDWTSSYRINYRAVGSSEPHYRQVAVEIVS